MAGERFCPTCGAAHGPGVRFCTSCGQAIDAAASPTPTAAQVPLPPGATAPVPPPEPRARRRPSTSLLVALATLVVVALVTAVLALTGGDDDDDDDLADTGSGEVFLEPISFAGEAPFTDSVDEHNRGTTATTAPVIATTQPDDPNAQAPTRSIPGAQPGLYGGTRNNASCDPDQLIDFLMSNPTKARAWGGVLDVAVDDIPEYIRSLTPVVLQRDTRVTNHGFRNGRATSLQSVLQAGTAVLVDEFGVPRVKCGCGNPLLEPNAVTTRLRYTGDRWPTFAPANVINVTVDVKVSVFVLVDTNGGEPFTRPPGTTGSEDGEVMVDHLCDMFPDDPACVATTTTAPGEPELGTGEVQVTLRWSSTADLDLAVTDPTGATIDYSARTSPSGGSLDVDSNGGCSSPTTSPVENVFWPTGAAPTGVYTATVTYYGACLPGGDGTQQFELVFRLDGAEVALTPVAHGGEAYSVAFAVVDDRPVVLSVDGSRAQSITGSLDPGGTAQYRAEKPVPRTPDAPTTTIDDGDGPERPSIDEPDCSMYEEGTPMRILCEHDPTQS